MSLVPVCGHYPLSLCRDEAAGTQRRARARVRVRKCVGGAPNCGAEQRISLLQVEQHTAAPCLQSAVAAAAPGFSHFNFLSLLSDK